MWIEGRTNSAHVMSLFNVTFNTVLSLHLLGTLVAIIFCDTKVCNRNCLYSAILSFITFESAFQLLAPHVRG